MFLSNITNWFAGKRHQSSPRRQTVSLQLLCLEGREMPVALSLAPPALGLAQYAPAPLALVAYTTDLNTQVLNYAKNHLGVRVGDGQCATLAVEAVKAAGGKPFSQLGPTGSNANYVWGRKITTLTPSSGSLSAIKPGDIIQFRDVSFKKVTKVTYPNGAWTQNSSTQTYGHHTAIVEGVNSKFIYLLQQNVGASGKANDPSHTKVQRGTIWGTSFTTSSTASDGTKTVTTYTFVGGTMWVYRPYR
jgi:hypothetical protein